MTRMIPRLALVVASALALSGFAASTALAQLSPTSTPAVSVGPESAVLKGTIDTTTQTGSQVCYSFEYDTVADYLGPKNNVQSSDDQCVPSGSGVIDVSALVGCYPAATCTGDNLPLDPASTYQYILGVQYEADGSYYNSEQLNSLQLEFTTSALGSLKLTSKAIPVKKGVAAISLLCNSRQSCHGSLQVTVRSRGRKLIALSSPLNIKASKAVTLKGKLSGKVRSLLAKASGGKLAATLTVIVTTDQNVFSSKRVTLVLISKS
ncbi:MAG: hypothetical protein ACLP8S_09915 [Solirubrobacteraceae bacterium]